MDKPNINITLTSSLYQLKNRHGTTLHLDWFRDFIRVVNQFYLVIYTSELEYTVLIHEIRQLDEDTQKKIKVVIKPFNEFYNYIHANFWIKNNNNPKCLSSYNVNDWKLNMLWCEKVHFVKQTIEYNYFDTEYHGWCDIGYFRDTLSNKSHESNDYSILIRDKWPNPHKINQLHKDKIYYGCNIESKFLHLGYNYHIKHFHPSNIDDKTCVPIDAYIPNAHIISGGFYITGRDKALWWCNLFQETLENYIMNNVVVQNEQHIIAHCVFMNEHQTNKDFFIIKTNKTHKDSIWFMFRDFLL